MANFKLVISDPKSKSYQIEVSGSQADSLIGSRIDGEVEGKNIGFDGYTLRITGGSDKEGVPMRRDVQGPIRRRILSAKSIGFKSLEKGVRRRKMVRGNTISDDINQVNFKVVKHGSTPIEEIIGKAD